MHRKRKYPKKNDSDIPSTAIYDAEIRRCKRRPLSELLDIWTRNRYPDDPPREGLDKSALCDVLRHEFARTPLKVISTDRKSKSIAVETSDVKLSNWQCRLWFLNAYLKTTDISKRIKVLGKGKQGTATLMSVKIMKNDKIGLKFPKPGVMHFVEKLNKIAKDDQSVFVSLSSKFNDLLDDDVHLLNDETDHAKYDTLFRNKIALTLEPVIELAGLFLLSQCVSQKICPNFPIFYGAVVSHKTFRFDIEVAHGGMTFRKWSKQRHSELEWNAALFQVLVGLHVMHTKFGMTHDDLHADNVLVNEMPRKVNGRPTFLHYILSGRHYYVPTFGRLFMLIDFGRVNVGNLMKIGWHHKLKHSDMKAVKGISKKEVYDYFHFVSYLVRFAPKAVREYILEMLVMMSSSDLVIEEVLIALFDDEVNNFSSKDCTTHGCFNTLPKNGELVGTYNVDKKIDIKKIPTTLHRVVK